jgi:hypothetical protein
MSWDPSVDPLSATTTSPTTPSVAKERDALRMQVARVSASFRQGRTTDSSTTPGVVGSGAGPAVGGVADLVSLGIDAAEVVAPGVDAAGVVALEDVMAVGSFPCRPTRPVRRATG